MSDLTSIITIKLFLLQKKNIYVWKCVNLPLNHIEFEIALKIIVVLNKLGHCHMSYVFSSVMTCSKYIFSKISRKDSNVLPSMLSWVSRTNKLEASLSVSLQWHLCSFPLWGAVRASGTSILSLSCFIFCSWQWLIQWIKGNNIHLKENVNKMMRRMQNENLFFICFVFFFLLLLLSLPSLGTARWQSSSSAVPLHTLIRFDGHPAAEFQGGHVFMKWHSWQKKTSI